MIIINLKDLYPSDSQQVYTDKVNYNFNQLLRLGIGQPGPQGPPGPQGGQGIPGLTGPAGQRGSYWYSGNYDAPTDDPFITGSPSPANVYDCYLTYSAGHLAMWQYQAGSPNSWVELADIDAILQSYISVTSPFQRVPGSPVPPNWGGMIIPLVVPGSGTWQNTLLMATENQDKLYTGAYVATNAVSLRKTQLALLNGQSSSIPHSILVGEMGYDYSGMTPDTANPKVQINNALRISSKYKAGAPPSYARSVFDMQSPDDGLRSDDVTTMMSFVTRHYDSPARAEVAAMFACRRAMVGYGYAALDDITLPSVEFGGLVLTNTATVGSTTAFAIGTNLNLDYPGTPTPYAYLLTNNLVSRIYVNNHTVPFRQTNPSKVISLGLAGNSGLTHWDNAFLKYGIGYDISDFKFWRNSGTSSYASTATNCAASLTKEGRIAIGKSLTNYGGVGSLYGLNFGNNLTSSGNASNRAALHIYEDLVESPTVLSMAEAGLVIEKRWGFLDRYVSTVGFKFGAAIHNVINVTSTSPGHVTALGAPDACALFMMQGQASTELTKGVVNNMLGVNMYMYAAANAANMGSVKGVSTEFDMQLSGGATTTNIANYKAYYAGVPDKIGGVEHVTDIIDGMAAKYGFYQGGAANALNYLAGHLQFSGLGNGYVLPYYGAVSGHVIGVLGTGTTTSDLTIASGAATASNDGGKLYLRAGYSVNSNGGDLVISGGPVGVSGTLATTYGGTVSIYGGHSDSNHLMGTGVPPDGAYDGDVLLCYNPITDDYVGRLGIRKGVPRVSLDDYNVHIDIEGNTRVNGDVLWGDMNLTGFQPLVEYDGASSYPDDVKFYNYSKTVVAKADLATSRINIYYKRIGCLLVLNYRMDLVSVAGIGGDGIFYMAWNPTVWPALGFGKFKSIRYSGSYYNRPIDACSASGVCIYSSNNVLSEVNAGYSDRSNVDIPAYNNVLLFNTDSVAGDTRYITGQIIIEMK